MENKSKNLLKTGWVIPCQINQEKQFFNLMPLDFSETIYKSSVCTNK